MMLARMTSCACSRRLCGRSVFICTILHVASYRPRADTSQDRPPYEAARHKPTPPLRITRIEVYGYDLTYAFGEYVMSSGRGARAQASTLVRVLTDEGVEGWGESCPLAGTYLPTFAGAVRTAIAELAPADR